MLYEHDFMQSIRTMEVVKSVVGGLNIDMYIKGYYWLDWLLAVSQDSLARDG